MKKQWKEPKLVVQHFVPNEMCQRAAHWITEPFFMLRILR